MSGGGEEAAGLTEQVAYIYHLAYKVSLVHFVFKLIVQRLAGRTFYIFLHCSIHVDTGKGVASISLYMAIKGILFYSRASSC